MKEMCYIYYGLEVLNGLYIDFYCMCIWYFFVSEVLFMVLRGFFSFCFFKGKKLVERYRQFKQKFIRKVDILRRDWSGILNGIFFKKNILSGVCIEGFKDVYEMVIYWWGKVVFFFFYIMMGQIFFEGYFF